MNIPVVFLLWLFSFQLGNTLKEKPISLFGYAWLVNLLHIFLKLICEYVPEEHLFLKISPYLIIFLDYLNTYFFLLCFYYASFELYERNDRKINSVIKRIKDSSDWLKYSLLLILFILSVSLEYYDVKPINGLVNIKSIPSVIISSTALFLVSYYFNTLYQRDHYLKTVGIRNEKLFQISNRKKVIVFGLVGFGFLQFLILFDLPEKSHITTVGYFISLSIKLTLLYGIIRFFVIEAQKALQTKVISEALSDIVGSIFHELTLPLNEVEEVSSDLENDSESWRMNKHAYKQVEKFDANYTRINAIVSAFINMHENLIDSEYTKTFDELFTLSDKDLDYHNLNSLIELCVQNIKTNYGETISFRVQYSKNPIVYCKATDVIQIISNLFKNSIDAFSGTDGKIFVKTKKIKNIEGKKLVQIQVADNGPGINSKIKPYIFEKGYSTKGDEVKVKGLGLFYVKKFLEHMDGEIKFESPYNFSDFDTSVLSGTLFTILIELSE